MLFFLTPEQAKQFRQVGFIVRDGERFRPGIDCPGKPDFRHSTRCRLYCFGAHGFCTSGGLPILCLRTEDVIAIRALNARGALGSRPKASLSRF